MFDHPFAQTIIAAYHREIEPTLRHSVGGIACAADVERAIAKVCEAHPDVTAAEACAWVKAAEGR